MSNAQGQKPEQEFDQASDRHRLVNRATGVATQWAGYRGTAYLDGWVGATAYYMPREGVYTADEFARAISHGTP